MSRSREPGTENGKQENGNHDLPFSVFRLPFSVFRLPFSVHMKTPAPETILFSVIGMTPAVLTETAWALAQRHPRVLPERVVVLTTLRGREQIRRELLDGGQWLALRKALKAGDRLEFADTGRHLVVFSHGGRELEDIRTPEQNLAAGDCIVEELRKFTSDPSKRVVASLAGGRKTMGALLYAAMTLIGRETDLITHVLVSEELERRKPPFYFPRTAAEKQGIELADIPFVPLGNRFRELGELPGGFRSLVAHYTRSLQSEGPAAVRLTADGAEINGSHVPLGSRLRTTLAFLVHLNQSGEIPAQGSAETPFRDFLSTRDAAWAKNLVFPEDLKRALSDLRGRFMKAGLTWMPGLRSQSLVLPPFRLV
jgi:CRISPR-associated protein (TIGR02584 family)